MEAQADWTHGGELFRSPMAKITMIKMAVSVRSDCQHTRAGFSKESDAPKYSEKKQLTSDMYGSGIV